MKFYNAFIHLRPTSLERPLAKITLGRFCTSKIGYDGVPEDIHDPMLALTLPNGETFTAHGTDGVFILRPGILSDAGAGEFHVMGRDDDDTVVALGAGDLEILTYPTTATVEAPVLPVSSVMDEDGTSRQLIAVKDEYGNWTLTVGEVIKTPDYARIDADAMPDDLGAGDNLLKVKAAINAIKKAVKPALVLMCTAFAALFAQARETLDEINPTNEIYTAAEVDVVHDRTDASITSITNTLAHKAEAGGVPYTGDLIAYSSDSTSWVKVNYKNGVYQSWSAHNGTRGDLDASGSGFTNVSKEAPSELSAIFPSSVCRIDVSFYVSLGYIEFNMVSDRWIVFSQKRFDLYCTTGTNTEMAVDSEKLGGKNIVQIEKEVLDSAATTATNVTKSVVTKEYVEGLGITSGGGGIESETDPVYNAEKGNYLTSESDPVYEAEKGNYLTSETDPVYTAEKDKYATTNSFNQLDAQMASVEAYLNGDVARFVSTNYNSSTKMAEAYVEIKTDDSTWLRVWEEMTRWNWAITNYLPNTYLTKATFEEPASKAWGYYDSHTGEYAPDGYASVSADVILAKDMAYEKKITTSGTVWLLTYSGTVMQTGGTTNGFFRITDESGNTHFEIVKGDKRTVGCDAASIQVYNVYSPAKVEVHYKVESDAHPTVYCSKSLGTTFVSETSEDSIVNVVWSGSSGDWVAIIQSKTATEQLFVQAEYEVGGDTYIRNVDAVSLPKLYIDGTSYNVKIYELNGHKLLELE